VAPENRFAKVRTSRTYCFNAECEVSASLRNGAVLFANRGGPGSVSQVFRKQGIDIVADTASTMASF
jgi:hypothetical protein